MAPKAHPYRATDGEVTWFVRYRIPGHPNPVKDTFRGEKAQVEAEKFARLIERVGGEAARATRRRGESSANHVPSLATWFETHLDTVASSGTPGTVADYRAMAKRTWLPTLGALPLDAIDRTAVVNWVGEQRKAETKNSAARRRTALTRRVKDPTVVVPEPEFYSAKSIANAQRLLSSTMAAAVEAGIITKNPARGVDLPSDQERHEMTLLTHNQFADLLDAVTPHYRPLVAFLAGTGCRWGEATALQARDFDLDADQPVVRVRRAWKKGETGVYLGSPKSEKGRRTITLPPSVVQLVRPLVEAAKFDTASGLVFATREGTRVQSQHFTYRVWRPALARVGIERLRVHDLRHTHASWLIAAGVTLPVIQRRLGHESIKTTVDVYGHMAPDAHAGAADAAEIAMSGALPQIEPPDRSDAA